MQSKNEFAGHLFALNYILRPTRPSTSDASPRVVDFNPQRPLEHAGAGTWCMHRIWDKSQRHLSADRWTSMGPHAVHKHAALTTMFSCSFVFLFPLSLSAYLPYLLLPHPWYVRPVQKGTSDIEPGIPDSFNCPTSHMIQKRNKGKSGGVFLIIVGAVVLIFGEKGCSLIKSGVSAVKERVCWTFVCAELHT